MSQWWLFLCLALRGTNTWWGCCVIYPCWLYAIHLCLLCLQFRQGQSSSWFPLVLLISAFFLYGAASWPDSMCDSQVTSGCTSDVLTQRCQFLLSQGLALPLGVFISLLNVPILTYATRMVALTGMAPSLLPMKRLPCALLHSWPTAWSMHHWSILVSGTFLLIMACWILWSAAFACSICSGE